MLAAVNDLLPALRERAQATEDLRRIPDENIAALQETGFFRLLQPTRYAGYEASPVDFYRAVRLIASACGSTGWVSSVIGVHPWQLGIFDDKAKTRSPQLWATTHRLPLLAGASALMVAALRRDND